MKAKNLKKDLFRVPKGIFFEAYTPIAGKIKSAALNDQILKYARFALSQDANVTFKDALGNAVSAFPLVKGEYFFLVSEISVVSAGSVAIIHDGELESGAQNE